MDCCFFGLAWGIRLNGVPAATSGTGFMALNVKFGFENDSQRVQSGSAWKLR